VIGHHQRSQSRCLLYERLYLTGKPVQLPGALDIAVKEDHTGGRGLGEHFTLGMSQFSAGQPRHEKWGQQPVYIADIGVHEIFSIRNFRGTGPAGPDPISSLRGLKRFCWQILP
jgi:hypothetical protein